MSGGGIEFASGVVAEEVVDVRGLLVRQFGRGRLWQIVFAGDSQRLPFHGQMAVAQPVQVRFLMAEDGGLGRVVRRPVPARFTGIVPAGPPDARIPFCILHPGGLGHLHIVVGLVVVVPDDSPIRQDLFLPLADNLKPSIAVLGETRLARQLEEMISEGIGVPDVRIHVPRPPEIERIIRARIEWLSRAVERIDGIRQRPGDEQLAAIDSDGLAAEAHRPLDVVLGDELVLRFLGPFEDDDFAAFRFAEMIERLQDEHSIARSIARFRVYLAGMPLVAAVGAAVAVQRHLATGLLVAFDLIVRIDGKHQAAFRTGDELVVAIERLGH